MYSNKRNHNPDRPPFQSVHLQDPLRERIRYLHYSIRTEKAYVYWARFFIRWHGMRHPREMGGPDVEAFLRYLANEREASVSTHHQALSTILFPCREALGIELPWMQDIGRPQTRRRIPAVLTIQEVQALLARLLYGTEMRLTEGQRLRVEDLDFDRRVIVVREGKGAKDRVVMMPLSPSTRARG